MKPVFDDPGYQKLYEEGHPFFVKLVELRSWSREDLEVRLANSIITLKAFQKSGRKSTIEFDRLCRQLVLRSAAAIVFLGIVAEDTVFDIIFPNASMQG